MKKTRFYRLGAIFLALAMVASILPVPALAVDLIPDYTCEDERVQAGGLYTLIALPKGTVPGDLTPQDLLDHFQDALYAASVTARQAGSVTFTGIKLKSADAVDFFVTGPGLTPPVKVSSGPSTGLEGNVTTGVADRSATLTLIDVRTGFHYATQTQAAARNGYYWFDRLAPGQYHVQVTKPGYLPYATTGDHWVDVHSGDSAVKNFDISQNLGDVNSDGQRSAADLSRLLQCYGRGSALYPANSYPDLDGSGQVDAADVAKLLATGDVPAGTGTAVAPSLAVTDTDLGGGLHKLVFSVASGGGDATVPAGAFTLTYRSDYVQPCNPNGGAISPVDGGTSANCLKVSTAFTLDSRRWSLAADTASLTFDLSAQEPVAAQSGGTALAEFYYRAVPGKTTADFFDQVFTLTHAAVLIGPSTVLDRAVLTYPNSENVRVASLTIDQTSQPLAIPAPGGNPTALQLSASGVTDDGLPVTGLGGVTWNLTGDNTQGVTIADGLLTVTYTALPGTLELTATRDGVTSDPITITLTRSEPTPQRVEIYRDLKLQSNDHLETTTQAAQSWVYTATVYDQYRDEMPGATVTWSLGGAYPQGVVLGGAGSRLEVPAGLAAGTYRFALVAASGDASQALPITLTVKAVAASLSIAGPETLTIPAAGESDLTAAFTVAVLDHQGSPMTPETPPTLALEGAPAGVTLTNGVLTVTPEAQPGAVTLKATLGDLTATRTVELLEPVEQASSLAIFREGQQVQSLALSEYLGHWTTPALTAQLLNAAGEPLEEQSPLTWTLTGAPEGVSWTTDENGLGGRLTFGDGLAAAQTYSFTLAATHEATGLTAQVSVTLEVLPVLGTLTLTGPTELTVPTQETVSHSFAATATDEGDQPMALPELTWQVTDGEGNTVDGLSVDPNGVLTIAPEVPGGAYRLTVSAPEPFSGETVSATLALTLTLPDVTVLRLYRDGEPVEETDSLNAKEGTPAQLSYTLCQVNLATGEATSVPASDMTWVRDMSSLATDEHTGRGTHTAQLTAILNADNSSVSVTASIRVYPVVVSLDARFDRPLEVPGRGASHVYQGELVAHSAKGEDIPLGELDYDYEISRLDHPLPGVLPQYDMQSHTLTLTMDSSAIAYKYLTASQEGRKSLAVTFSHFPGEESSDYLIPLTFTSAPSVAQNGVLRVGIQGPNGVSFRTLSAGGDTITTAQNTFSNCYAIELTDQYGQSMTGSEVTWTLTGAPSGVTLSQDTAHGDSFINYASFRRLAVSSDAPPGKYELTLTAASGNFTYILDIHLTITESGGFDQNSVTGSAAPAIPMYYSQVNDPSKHDADRTYSYTATFRNASGQAPNEDSTQVVWSLDKSRAGVSLNSSTGVLTVSRSATPGDVTIVATLRSRADREVLGAARTTVTLTRPGSSVPTILSITKAGRAITSDSLTASQGGNIQATYGFDLVDQYNVPVSDGVRDEVTWSATRLPSGVSFNASNATLTVTPQAAGGTLSLSATLPKNAAGSNSSVFLTIPVTITPASGGGGGGGGGGPTGPTGPSGPTDPGGDTPPTPTQAVAPALTLSGSAGTATLTPEEEALLLTQSAPTIVPANDAGLTSVSVTVTSSALATLAAGGRPLTLQTSVGVLALDAATLRGAASAGGNVAISISRTQNGFQVTVTTPSGALRPFAGTATLTAGAAHLAPSAGTVGVYVSPDGSQVLLRKSVVENGTLITPVPGSGEVQLVNRGLTFADTRNHWAGDAVRFVTARNLFLGVSDSAFDPAGTMTRAMVVTVLHRLESEPNVAQTVSFVDVAPGQWYSAAVAWGNQKGIVKGNGAGFDPSGPVTREQLATILYRYAQTVNCPTTGRKALTGFPDGSKTSSWASDAMSWAVSMGLISGKSGGLLDPGGNASRAEVATILERFIRAMAANRK